MRSAVFATLLAGGVAVGGATVWKSAIISSTTNSVPTACSSAAAGDLCSEDDTLVGDDLTVSGAAAITGVATFSGGVSLATPSFPLHAIRFCGNGPDGGTETFVSPVPFDDTEADFVSGGAGCDAEDNTTIATADEPWPMLEKAAFKPVAGICTAFCTGSTAANDAIVFKLYDDTAAVSEATCTTAALGGDATAAQCTWTDTTPPTVASASKIAIGIDNTDDDCNDSGDDFECVIYVTF